MHGRYYSDFGICRWLPFLKIIILNWIKQPLLRFEIAAVSLLPMDPRTKMKTLIVSPGDGRFQQTRNNSFPISNIKATFYFSFNKRHPFLDLFSFLKDGFSLIDRHFL